MLIKLLSVVGRHRGAVMVGSLVLTVVLGVLRQVPSEPLRDFGFYAYLWIVIGLLFVAIAGLSRPRPATLLVRPEVPAFATPPHAAQVLLIAVFTFQLGGSAVDRVGELVRGEELAGVSLVLAVLSCVLLVWAWWQMLRLLGVRLSPEGIEERQAFGSIVVPWEAFAGVGYPAHAIGRDRVALTFSRPDLVRARGWRPRGQEIWPMGTDALFLARVLHEYAHRPDLRSAIGTESERDRLVATWGTASLA